MRSGRCPLNIWPTLLARLELRDTLPPLLRLLLFLKILQESVTETWLYHVHYVKKKQACLQKCTQLLTWRDSLRKRRGRWIQWSLCWQHHHQVTTSLWTLTLNFSWTSLQDHSNGEIVTFTTQMLCLSVINLLNKSLNKWISGCGWLMCSDSMFDGVWHDEKNKHRSTHIGIPSRRRSLFLKVQHLWCGRHSVHKQNIWTTNTITTKG